MKYSRGTEIKIKKYPKFKIVFGTMDKNNPKSVYIKISAWGNPIDYDETNNYKTIISRMTKNVKTLLYKEIDRTKFNHNRILVDFDMRDSGILEDKASFMSCEITLLQYNHFLLTTNTIQTSLNDIVKKLIDEVFLDNYYFEFYKKKIDAKKHLNEA